MKRISKLLLLLTVFALILSLAACSSGYKVTYVLPEGASGAAPAAQSIESYTQFTVPSVDSALNNAPQVGWEDISGNFFANGSTITMGSADLQLTAVYQAVSVTESFCENPGTFAMPGKGVIGPTPAYTIFYADKTWTADATGEACFSHFEGTWDLSASGELTMVLTVQDGVERNTQLELSFDGKTYTYTLSHPGDRGGMKDHVNHISAYALISAYNQATGSAIPVPDEPVFTISFASGADDGSVTGEVAAVSGKLGETVQLPACGFTREGFTFSGWQYDRATYQPGDELPVNGYDATVTATWKANE